MSVLLRKGIRFVFNTLLITELCLHIMRIHEILIRINILLRVRYIHDTDTDTYIHVSRRYVIICVMVMISYDVMTT